MQERINITCSCICDMIWSFLSRLDLHRALQHDLHLAHQHDARSMTPPVDCPPVEQLITTTWHAGHKRIWTTNWLLPVVLHQTTSHTSKTEFNHITSHALQNKVRHLYFIFCKFYVASRAFAKNRFLTNEHQPQHRLTHCRLTHSGALLCTYPYHYGMQTASPKATCVLWTYLA